MPELYARGDVTEDEEEQAGLASTGVAATGHALVVLDACVVGACSGAGVSAEHKARLLGVRARFLPCGFANVCLAGRAQAALARCALAARPEFAALYLAKPYGGLRVELVDCSAQGRVFSPAPPRLPPDALRLTPPGFGVEPRVGAVGGADWAGAGTHIRAAAEQGAAALREAAGALRAGAAQNASCPGQPRLAVAPADAAQLRALALEPIRTAVAARGFPGGALLRPAVAEAAAALAEAEQEGAVPVCELASRHLPRPDEAPREAVEALLREALAAELEAVPFPLEPFLLSRAPAVCAPRAWPWRCLPS